MKRCLAIAGRLVPVFRLSLLAAILAAAAILSFAPPAEAHGGRVFVRGSGVAVQGGGANVVVQRRGIFGRRSTVIVNGGGVPVQSFHHGGVIFVR